MTRYRSAMGLDDALARAQSVESQRAAAKKLKRDEEAARLEHVRTRLQTLGAEAVAYCRSQGRTQRAGIFEVDEQRDASGPHWSYLLELPLWEFRPFLLDESGTIYANPVNRSLVPTGVYIYDDRIASAKSTALAQHGMTSLYTGADPVLATGEEITFVSEWDKGATIYLRPDGLLWRTQGLRPFEDEVSAALITG